MEELFIIPNCPNYFITKTGKVWSNYTNKFLKIREQSSGYKFFSVQINQKQKHILLHRALAFVFLDLPELTSNLEVDHIDRVKSNNCLSNLQVLSIKEHRIKTGLDNGTIKADNVIENTYLKVRCKVCGKDNLHRNNKSKICKKCGISKILLEDIVYWVKNYSWSRASRELGMSDNGLRKKYKKLSGKDPKLLKC